MILAVALGLVPVTCALGVQPKQLCNPIDVHHRFQFHPEKTRRINSKFETNGKESSIIENSGFDGILILHIPCHHRIIHEVKLADLATQVAKSNQRENGP